jgi:diketogulonate reductase-like aldo/keto reductase
MNIPQFIYGTAWKEERTEALCLEALAQGFRAIDTANQRKHYFEEAVGRALNKAFKEGGTRREDIFIQTKFTFLEGQDQRLPYDPKARIYEQVQQSFESSLKHLGVENVDSYILHGPSTYPSLADEDFEAWESMESLVTASKVKSIGLSNISLEQLKAFYDRAKIKPTYVQNRCFASRFWDRAVRSFCKEKGIHYQGFSLLTANLPYLKSETVASLAQKYNKTIPQIAFRFSDQIGIIPLTGTSSAQHMKEDLNSFDFDLTDEEIRTIEELAHRG